MSIFAFSNFNFSFLVRRLDIKNRPRIPIPDEDPYAIAADIESSASSSFGNGVYGHHGRDKMMAPSQYRRDKPPKLPPRGNIYVHRDEVAGVMKVIKLKLRNYKRSSK